MNQSSVAGAKALTLAIWIAAFGGCSSPPTLTHPEHFYLQGPADKTFEYERTLPAESWIRGTLTLAVEQVELADGNDDTYRMSGTVSLTSRGAIKGREAAREAPQDVVQAAMEPDNVTEVFETVSSQPGITVTRIHWDRLRTLRLPLEYEHDMPASPFSSSLRGEALGDAAEVALVWHKVIAPFLSIYPFGEFSASDVDEREESLELTLIQKLPTGAAVRFRYRFERGHGLSGLETTLPDGSVLRVRTQE